jgi:hypothetical protein
VAEDWPGGGTAERPHDLKGCGDERVDREQDNQRLNRHTRPGNGNDPDYDAQDAKQDQ